MKKTKSRVLSVMLAAFVTIGCMSNFTTVSASSKKEHNGIDVSKEVKLKMYLLGDGATDVDLVYGEISKTLKETINATISVDFLSWAEHDTKYSLLFSSGEDFDIIFTAAGWGHYEQTATKKGFYELKEDFIKKYAPDIYEVVPEAAWNQAKIDGKVFMVPNYSVEYGYDVIGVRGDLMEKYGFETIESKADLEAFYDAAIKGEKNMTALATNGGALQYPYLFQGDGFGVVRGTPLPLILYELKDPKNTTAVSIVETDTFREYAHKMKEMLDKNYWSADSLSSNDSRQDPWVSGKAISMVWNVNNLTNYAQEINKEHPEWKATFVDIAPDQKRAVNPYTNNGVAINAASKNAERAMMAINEFMTNPVVYDLASLGVEGVHYEAIDDDKYAPLADAGKFPAMGVCNWGWNNDNLKRGIFVEDPDPIIQKSKETIAQWTKDLTSNHPLDAFSFTEANVKNEVAVINTIITQYLDPIHVGVVDDPDAAVDELISQLKKAGIDKVMTEVQKQIDEFIEANK